MLDIRQSDGSEGASVIFFGYYWVVKRIIFIHKTEGRLRDIHKADVHRFSDISWLFFIQPKISVSVGVGVGVGVGVHPNSR